MVTAWPEIIYNQSYTLPPPVEYYVADIKEQMSKGKTKIIFECSGESLLRHILKSIHTIIDLIPELNPKDVFYVTSALDGQKSYDKYIESIGRTDLNIGILSRSTFEQTTIDWMKDMHIRDEQNIPEEDPLEYKVKLKEKKFVYFNRIMRGHRLLLLTKIIESGLIKDSFCSAGYPEHWREGLCKYNSIKPEFEPLYTRILEATKILPLRLNMSPERDNPINLLYEDIHYHANSYFSLVTETSFFESNTSLISEFTRIDMLKTVFLTEKTFRPIAFKHPFILCSNYDIHAELRRLGYKTFHPYINETYNIIKDDDERIDAIYKEVLRLCSFTDEQWIKWQINIKPIVEHNYNVLMNKQQKHTGITKNIDELFNR